jgi:NitT/TauT family transport system permease protein
VGEVQSVPPQPSHADSSVAPARRSAPSRVAPLAIPLLVIVAVVIAWAAVVRIFDIPDYLLPAPQAVFIG